MKQKELELEFFDTETINNKTVLICNSETYLWNSSGLSSKECFDFIIKNAKDYNYFFRIDYDINMIIKDLPKKIITTLFEKNEVNYNGYDIKYFRNKIFSINGKTFYDVANFFQTSLIRNIEILKIDLTDVEKKFIESMKRQRKKFSLRDKNKIINYSLLENQVGLKIVNKIYELIPDELKTYALYGASALTNKFLKDKTQSNFVFNNELFNNAYFGGRMECLKIGTFYNCYKYDINSAYPNVIKDLQQPVTYEIKKYSGQKIVDTNIYEVEFNHKTINEIGCLPLRLNDGYLIFPKEGKGYYYGCELLQAINRGVNVKINNFVDVKLGKKIFNKNEIEKIYELRKTLKLKNDLRNLIYKILLNSIYGKFAQQVGKSQYQNIYLAGYITAKVRSELLKATYKKDSEIIFFATDGILSKTKLKLPISDKLGDYEEIKIKKAVVILSGIYKLIDYNNKEYIGERGFRFNFDRCLSDIMKKGYHKAKLTVFISNIFAFKNYKKLSKYRCKFTIIEKVINIKNQKKRIFKTFDIEKENNSLLLNKESIKKYNERISKIKDMFDINFIEIPNNDDIFIL